MSLGDPALHDLFQQHLLPVLPIQLLATLRGLNSGMGALVDISSGAVWHTHAQEHLTADILPHHVDGFAVQQRLRIHAQLSRYLISGGCPDEWLAWSSTCLLEVPHCLGPWAGPGEEWIACMPAIRNRSRWAQDRRGQVGGPCLVGCICAELNVEAP